MDISFHGKRALVTGASQGIGRDIAMQLTKCGAKVIAVARNKELLVNISSQTSKIGLGRHAVYCGTKGAVDAYTRAVALELGPHNIRVNCVNPTVIMTEMGKQGYSDPTLAGPLKQQIPLRRFGEVREVTDARQSQHDYRRIAFGIGRDIVKQLAKGGAKVIAVARNKELLESLKQEQPTIEVISCDLSDWDATKQALYNIGPVDLLVNNAGLAILKPLTEMTEEEVDKLFGINVKALINVTQVVVKGLLERKAPGAIVNISSQASQVGLLNHSVYCSTKGAVDAYTRAAALELGPHQIRVNCVNPTVIMTDMGKLGWSDPKVAEPMLQKIPLRRFGEVQEVVDAVLYLLSDKSTMEISLSGKRALVTGASRGIGRAIVVNLAKCGAKVIAIGRSRSDLESLKFEVPSVEIIAVDISDWKATENVLKNIGPVDLLVNNAGEGMIKSLIDLEEEDIDRIFSLNTKGLINVTRMIANDLITRKAPGAIVNISSQASLAGLLKHTVYAASKGAVDAFTRACAVELGPYNIRVNAVNPTVIMTEMGRKWWSEPSRSGTMLHKIPLGRFGEVHEVVDAVLYLLSDKASMITGTCLPIDGGIGRAITKQLVKCGAQVVAVGRNQEQLASLKEEVPSIETIALDLSDWETTKNALSDIGPVDLLVNNAGLGWLKPMMEITEDDVDSVLAINTKALIHVTQIVAKNLLERKAPGSIVNISSQASLAGLMHHTVYCASKGAVDAFTRAAALELGPHNVRVNCVNPTVIMTDMGRLGWSDPKVAQPMLQKIPLRRFGEVNEVVDAVLYLLSDKASMITGTCLPVDESLKTEIPSVELLPVDLSDWTATAEAVKTACPIDLLVNNAGLGFIEPLTSLTEEQFDKMFAVNVKALINVTKVVIEDLKMRKAPGAIVNISSQASKAGLLHHTLYCASKGAVDAFARAAALEFGPDNIRINCVNPTVVMTDLGRRIWSNPDMGEPMLAKIPIKRFAEIEDVADAVLFLLSDKAEMITGSCLAVDALATIDLNFAELEYLADHLLPEECRRLVAAAHFKSYMEPNFLDQAERAIPKDEPCLQLLLHWNSAEGEGRGETHEALEHRLRQMGKYELADWLGKTVFHQLGEDLENSLHE
ncbi:L-xylulose reductase, partial [Asbolus verrucosus]